MTLSPAKTPWPGISFAFFLLTLGALLLRNYGDRSFVIEDVGKPQKIRLLARHASLHTESISLKLSGTLDGTATIEGDCLRVTLNPGRVSFDARSEYYDNGCTLVYEPQTARKGHLTIRYAFFQL